MIKLFVNISLSLLILVSSTGVSFFKHYCSKSDTKLMSLVGAVSCEHEAVKMETCGGSCNHDSQIPHQKDLENNCCVNYTDLIKVDLNFLKSLHVKINKPAVLSLVQTNNLLTEQISEKINSFNHFDPPPLLYNKEILVSCCTFLL